MSFVSGITSSTHSKCGFDLKVEAMHTCMPGRRCMVDYTEAIKASVLHCVTLNLNLFN